MRTSNIILISMFMATVCMMTILHSIVYQKAKNNETEDGTYYRLKEEREEYTTTSLQPFNSIKLDNSYEVLLAYSPDYRLLVQNLEKAKVSFIQKDSTLTIQEAKDPSSIHNMAYRYGGMVFNKRVIIYCPNFRKVHLEHASILIDSFPLKDMPIINLHANNGSFIVGQDLDWEDMLMPGKVLFNKMNVQLDSLSAFHMQYNYQLKQLDIKATDKANIHIKSKAIDSLNINIGDSSNLEIPSILLKKTKLIL